MRRDLTRWTSQVKRGPSAHVRCPTGEVVSTPAFGELLSDGVAHVIHAVAPDSEFGYEGQYTGGLRGAAEAGVRGHQVTDADLPHFSPPDGLLLATYAGAFREAARLGAPNVACAALGSGVKGWKPAITAAMALEALARHELARAAAARAGSGGGGAPACAVAEVTFVIGGARNLAQESWDVWTRVATSLLGPPACGSGTAHDDAARRLHGGGQHGGGQRGHSPRHEGAHGPSERMTWLLDLQAMGAAACTTTLATNAAAAPAGEPPPPPLIGGAPIDRPPASDHNCEHVLPLEAVVPEVQQMLFNRARGFSGMEVALTAEQELAATRRRVTGAGQ